MEGLRNHLAKDNVIVIVIVVVFIVVVFVVVVVDVDVDLFAKAAVKAAVRKSQS